MTTTPEPKVSFDEELKRGLKIETVPVLVVVGCFTQTALLIWLNVQSTVLLTLNAGASPLGKYLLEHPVQLLIAPVLALLFFELTFFKKIITFFPHGATSGKVALIVVTLLRLLTIGLVSAYCASGLYVGVPLIIHYISWAFFKNAAWMAQDEIARGSEWLLKRQLDAADVQDFILLQASRAGGRNQEAVADASKYLEQHLPQLEAAYFSSLKEGQLLAAELLRELKATKSLARAAESFVDNLFKKDADVIFGGGKKILETAVNFNKGSSKGTSSWSWESLAGEAFNVYLGAQAHPFLAAGAVALCLAGGVWVIKYISLHVDPTLVILIDQADKLNTRVAATDKNIRAVNRSMNKQVDALNNRLDYLEARGDVYNEINAEEFTKIKAQIAEQFLRLDTYDKADVAPYVEITTRLDTFFRSQDKINNEVTDHLNAASRGWACHQQLLAFVEPKSYTRQHHVDRIFGALHVENVPQLRMSGRSGQEHLQAHGIADFDASAGPVQKLAAGLKGTIASGDNRNVELAGRLTPTGLAFSITCNEVSATRILEFITKLFRSK